MLDWLIGWFSKFTKLLAKIWRKAKWLVYFNEM